jgi:protein tyrosine phosphatase (PTP) superfamily phosphohydrolase (DUF442 family)
MHEETYKARCSAFLSAVLLLCPLLAVSPVLRAADSAGAPRASLPGIKPVELPGIHNAFQIGGRYFTGSVPEGDASFAALAKAGVKTIITVDGARPDVEGAKKYGIRYIHLPHGYDAVSKNAIVQIAKAVTTVEGPIFFHCHHGKHRGPAAAAIACITTEGWSPEFADKWLRLAGTDTNYAGLYRTVENFRPFSADELKAIPANLPERAKVSGLVEAMVEVDTRWDHLKAVRKAGYQVPKESPDIVPANEATILMEHYRESQRLEDSRKHGEKFLRQLTEGEKLALDAARLLREHASKPGPELVRQLDAAFDGLNRSCATCHKAFRN